MNRTRRDDVSPLKPVGMALASVVAGLGVTQAERTTEARPRAPLEPAGQAHTYFLDPTNHPGFEEDAGLVFGESEPAPVLLGAEEQQEQADLFDL